MRRNRILLHLSLLFIAAMLGWYFRDVFENFVGGKSGTTAESKKDLSESASRLPQSLNDPARPGTAPQAGAVTSRELTADSRASNDLVGKAIAQQMAQPTASLPPPITMLPQGVQSSDVQISPDGSEMHFARLPSASGESQPSKPAARPVVQPVDIRVLPDGTRAYLVRVPSASAQSGSAPLMMLPPNVLPNEVELSPGGIFETVSRRPETDVRKALPPDGKAPASPPASKPTKK
jgi:hypothetical protein